jgi:hypothetical protein
MTEQTTVEEKFILESTILLRVEPEEDRMQVVTSEAGSDREALIVFRTKEQAAAFQESTGKCTKEEGFARVGIGSEGIAKILEMQGIPYVAMPREGDGDKNGVDFFTGENFVWLVESRKLD